MRLELTEDVTVSEATSVDWMLIGQDGQAADVGGSTVARGSVAIDEPHNEIDHGWGPPDPEDALYWFDVTVDLDGDGRICPGDLFEDFDARDLQFFRGEAPTDVTIALHRIPEDWMVNPCDE